MKAIRFRGVAYIKDKRKRQHLFDGRFEVIRLMKAETDTIKRALTRYVVMKDYAEKDLWGHKAASIVRRIEWVRNEYQPLIVGGSTSVSPTADFQFK